MKWIDVFGIAMIALAVSMISFSVECVLKCTKPDLMAVHIACIVANTASMMVVCVAMFKR